MSIVEPHEVVPSPDRENLFLVSGKRPPLTQRERTSLAILASVLAILAWAGALGCMSPQPPAHLIASDPPIQVEFQNNLNTLRPGMSRSRVEWNMRGTSLRLAGRTECEGGHIDAYEFSKERQMASGQKRTEYLWFYFKDDALIRWGPPGDWPVIEKEGASEAKPNAVPSRPTETTPTMTPSGVPYAPPK